MPAVNKISEQNTTTTTTTAKANITAKFKINEFETIAQVYPSDFTIANVLKDIAQKFQLSSKYLTIQNEVGAAIVSSALHLYEICQNEFLIVHFRLVLSDLAECINANAETEYEKIKLDSDVYYRHYQLPDFVSVLVPANNEDPNVLTGKRLIVEIINKPIVKPFLGGWVNKITGIEYHNAFTQTGPIFERIKRDGRITRDTQTTESRYVNTRNQISRPVQADPHEAKRTTKGYVIRPRSRPKYDIQKIILIQRNFRRYLWQKLIQESAAEWRQKIQQKGLKKLPLKRERKLTVENARTKHDFDKLLAQVQQWKATEIRRINKHYSGGARLAELKLLLEQEISFLNKIERRRLDVHKTAEEMKKEQFLEQLGAPVKWTGYNNINCEMDLLRTQKIRKLTSLYRRLKQKMDKFNRIEFLVKFSAELKNFFVGDSLQDLIELFLEEKDLLTIDVDDNVLTELRKRQAEKFAALIKNEKLYTPSIHKKEPCGKCGILRSTNEFELNTRQRDSNICKFCHKLMISSIDTSPYKLMLNTIRREERKRNALSSCAFVMQPEDIREIVETIWHGHSVLSQCNDRDELRLPRWDKSHDWSPWNCVCLTIEETLAHTKIQKLDEVYESSLMTTINNNHQLAKIMFKPERLK